MSAFYPTCPRVAGVGATAEQVEHGVVALAKVLIDSTKNKMNKSMFMISAADLPLSEPHKQAMCEFFLANRDKIRKALDTVDMALPEFQHLDWRLDVEVGSRLVHQTIKPSFMLRLDTTQAGNKQT